MGVRHSTNVDRLMNTVFRQVVIQAVEQVPPSPRSIPATIGVRITMAPR